MKLSTFFGIVCGSLAIFGAFIWEGGSIDALFMLPAMLIVFGGTLAAGLAGSSFRQLFKMPSLIKIAVAPPVYDTEAIINTIIEYSVIARKEGILALENKLSELPVLHLRKFFQLCIDGADPETLRRSVEIEISYLSERHQSNINFFLKLGGYSPTMGIIGTVMGLISTLASAGSEPTVLIHHIASAFIATMWGIFMANIVWLPIGDKLKTIHDEEIQLLHLMLEGVHAVQLGEVPSVIRSRLISAFPIKEQIKHINKYINIQKKNVSMPSKQTSGNKTAQKSETAPVEVKTEVRI